MSKSIAVLCVLLPSVLPAAEPARIGLRLEPLVDAYLIEKVAGDVKLRLHRPEPREVVLTTDKPWEGNTCAYYTIFRDGDLFRMYYRGSHYDTKTKRAGHREVTCYAESKDGIHWNKPELGLFEFGGSKKNNIVWDGVGTHCFAAFKDDNPASPPAAKYKAISRGRPRGKRGLYVFGSPDGIHWKLLHPEPVITTGAFDSQNLAFWDPHAKLYREYHRIFVNGVRSIMTGTSKDFIHWSKPVLLKFGAAPKEHLYTNAVCNYPGAPHVLIGFPTRYLPKSQQVEPVFMSSRDGRTFHRWTEPVVPRTAPKDRDGNRSNYMTWGVLELPGDDKHYSVYATEAYYTGPSSRVRRFEYRKDGFTSMRAGATGGELATRPLQFEGNTLVVNYAAGKGGSLRVELIGNDGKPIASRMLADCDPLTGDAIAHTVTWKGKSSLNAAGSVRLRLVLKNADLYSLRFAK